jgi:hypothetical protein
MAAPRTSTAAGKDVTMVPASPKRPRDDEDEEVSRTIQTQTMEPRGSIMNIDIHSAVVSMRLHRGPGESTRSASHILKHPSSAEHRTRLRSSLDSLVLRPTEPRHESATPKSEMRPGNKLRPQATLRPERGLILHPPRQMHSTGWEWSSPPRVAVRVSGG